MKINIVVIDDKPKEKRDFIKHHDAGAASVVDQDIMWYFDAKVSSLDTNGIQLDDGRRIESKTVVWTEGYRASELTHNISAKRDCLDRLYVDQHLQVLGNPGIYAVGDVAFSSATDDGRYPTFLYQVATSMGDLAGRNVVAEMLGVARKNLCSV